MLISLEISERDGEAHQNHPMEVPQERHFPQDPIKISNKNTQTTYPLKISYTYIYIYTFIAFYSHLNITIFDRYIIISSISMLHSRHVFFSPEATYPPKKSQEFLGLLDRVGGDLHLHLLDDRPEPWLTRWINRRRFRSFAVGGDCSIGK